MQEQESSSPKSAKRRVLLIIIPLLSFVALCGLICALIQPTQPGCPYYRIWFTNKCEYDRTFQASDLLVDESYFQMAVRVVSIEPVAHHGRVERFLLEVYSDDQKRIAVNEVERWGWTSVAKTQYRDSVDNDFRYISFPCCFTDQIDMGDSTADELTTHCSTSGYCMVIARYQEYVITFGTEISPELTESDFKAIFTKINHNISIHLGLSK